MGVIQTITRVQIVFWQKYVPICLQDVPGEDLGLETDYND